MEISIRKNHELRLKAFDLLNELKGNGFSKKEIFDKIHYEFGIPSTTLKHWYYGSYNPFGRRGELTYRPELFYVLGALLGDGCLYNYKITRHYIILVGDKKFATKYATMLSLCVGRLVKPYIDRSKNIWFVTTNNFELYSLFKKIREDLNCLEKMMQQTERKSLLLFVEGFFDAEGCVKIIREEVRITPKICLDMTNTNFELIDFVRRVLKDNLDIDAKYSIQKPEIGKDGSLRKKAYHLRIYKKEFVKKFFENINTIKLKEEKISYVENWLKTKNKSTLEIDCSFLQPAPS